MTTSLSIGHVYSATSFATSSKALEDGRISGDGNFTKRCHELLEKELAVPKAC